jgi:hypothetical protein
LPHQKSNPKEPMPQVVNPRVLTRGRFILSLLFALLGGSPRYRNPKTRSRVPVRAHPASGCLADEALRRLEIKCILPLFSKPRGNDTFLAERVAPGTSL